MTLTAFLATVSGNGRPCMHRRRWLDTLGDDAFRALRQAGFLASAGRADWYPCGGGCGGAAQRVVLEEPIGEDRWLAVCGAEGADCLDEEVAGCDLELLAAAPERLATWLRTALGATGPVFRQQRYPGVHGVGLVRRGGEGREVVLVVGLPAWQLEHLVDDLARTGTPWLLLVPTWAAVPGDLRLRAAGGAVMFAALEPLLFLDAGQLELHPDLPYGQGSPPPLRVSDAASTAPSPPVVCTVLDHEGERALTVAEYQALVARAAEFDLFLDTTVAVGGGGHRGHHRTPQGQVIEDVLTRNEATVALELIRRRLALGITDFRTISANAIDKAVEHSRRKLDFSPARYKWRSFQTLRGATPREKRWLFNPPKDLRFLVIFPAEGERTR